MSIFLAGTSAIEYLRAHLTSDGAAPYACDFRGTAPTKAELRQALDGSLIGMSAPLEILLPARGRSRKPNDNPLVHKRYWGCRLPTHAFVTIDEAAGIYASVPEFAFAQAAKHLSLTELMMLGYEICGSYLVPADAQGAAYSCEPASTPERLTRFLARTPGFGGRAKAVRSMRYVIASSASPQETRLVLILCLPCGMGGYGLPFPKMNYTLAPNAIDAPFTSQRTFVCDLFWEKARLDVEYDSDQFHAAAAKMARDARRRSELALLGVQIISVTRQQLASTHETEKVARAIARSLGAQLRTTRVTDWELRHRMLRQELFAAERRIGSQ